MGCAAHGTKRKEGGPKAALDAICLDLRRIGTSRRMGQVRGLPAVGLATTRGGFS